MIKAIFIDIDGTLSDSKKNISERNINAIKKATENGILVVICSGRPRIYTENVSKKCFASKYIINCTGANIYDYENNVSLYNSVIDRNIVMKLYNITQKEDLILVLDTIDSRRVTKLEGPEDDSVIVENIEDFLSKNDVLGCIIADENIEKMKKILPDIESVEGIAIKNRHRKLVDPSSDADGILFYDIGNKEINKGMAIKKFIDILNIKKEETMAIGDDSNDLQMFENVGYKVAMGNALDCLKDYADEIAPTNDEDGVAIVIEKILKSGGLI